MTRTNNNGNQAKHMNQNSTRNGSRRRGAAVVALAIAGVLAVGGVSAVCVAGLGKSPGQAPVAAQTTTAQKATPAKTTTPAKATPAKAEAKQAEKPAQQAQQQAAKAEAKPAQQAQPAKQQAQQQPAKQQAQQQPAKQQAQQQPAKQQAQPARQQVKPRAEQAPGMEAKVSREQCIAIACAHVGAGGQAKGEAKNVTAKGPITGGGTVYYQVELDLGEVHYCVTVDAVEGNVIGADQTHAGTRTLLDSEGNPVEGTEWKVSA